MKKIFCILMVFVICIIPMTVYASFPDVPENHWAIQYINELSSKNIINGYTDGRFGPSDTLTNGQFLKLIITASFKNPDFRIIEPDFEHWAAVYLKVAENNKIVDGKKIVINQENIDQPINRITVVKIMSLCDLKIRNNVQRSTPLSFKDTANLGTSEKTLLRHAVAMGIIGGYTDKTFKPYNNLTRAEASKILSLYINYNYKGTDSYSSNG